MKQRTGRTGPSELEDKVEKKNPERARKGKEAQKE